MEDWNNNMNMKFPHLIHSSNSLNSESGFDYKNIQFNDLNASSVNYIQDIYNRERTLPQSPYIPEYSLQSISKPVKPSSNSQNVSTCQNIEQPYFSPQQLSNQTHFLMQPVSSNVNDGLTAWHYNNILKTYSEIPGHVNFNKNVVKVNKDPPPAHCGGRQITNKLPSHSVNSNVKAQNTFETSKLNESYQTFTDAQSNFQSKNLSALPSSLTNIPSNIVELGLMKKLILGNQSILYGGINKNDCQEESSNNVKDQLNSYFTLPSLNNFCNQGNNKLDSNIYNSQTFSETSEPTNHLNFNISNGNVSANSPLNSNVANNLNVYSSFPSNYETNNSEVYEKFRNVEFLKQNSIDMNSNIEMNASTSSAVQAAADSTTKPKKNIKGNKTYDVADKTQKAKNKKEQTMKEEGMFENNDRYNDCRYTGDVSTESNKFCAVNYNTSLESNSLNLNQSPSVNDTTGSAQINENYIESSFSSKVDVDNSCLHSQSLESEKLICTTDNSESVVMKPPEFTQNIGSFNLQSTNSMQICQQPANVTTENNFNTVISDPLNDEFGHLTSPTFNIGRNIISNPTSNNMNTNINTKTEKLISNDFVNSFMGFLQGKKQETLASVSSISLGVKPALPKYIPDLCLTKRTATDSNAESFITKENRSVMSNSVSNLKNNKTPTYKKSKISKNCRKRRKNSSSSSEEDEDFLEEVAADSKTRRSSKQIILQPKDKNESEDDDDDEEEDEDEDLDPAWMPHKDKGMCLSNLKKKKLATELSSFRSFDVDGVKVKAHNCQKGDFLLDSRDELRLSNGGCNIWRIDSGKLLQKYEPIPCKKIAGSDHHKNPIYFKPSVSYSSWSENLLSMFYLLKTEHDECLIHEVDAFQDIYVVNVYKDVMLFVDKSGNHDSMQKKVEEQFFKRQQITQQNKSIILKQPSPHDHHEQSHEHNESTAENQQITNQQVIQQEQPHQAGENAEHFINTSHDIGKHTSNSDTLNNYNCETSDQQNAEKSNNIHHPIYDLSDTICMPGNEENVDSTQRRHSELEISNEYSSIKNTANRIVCVIVNQCLHRDFISNIMNQPGDHTRDLWFKFEDKLARRKNKIISSVQWHANFLECMCKYSSFKTSHYNGQSTSCQATGMEVGTILVEFNGVQYDHNTFEVMRRLQPIEFVVGETTLSLMTFHQTLHQFKFHLYCMCNNKVADLKKDQNMSNDLILNSFSKDTYFMQMVEKETLRILKETEKFE